MKKSSLIIGSILGLSAYGTMALNGDCPGFHHKLVLNSQAIWCLNDKDLEKAQDFLRSRIAGSNSYEPAFALALLEYEKDFRIEIKELLRVKQEQSHEIDEDDFVLTGFFSKERADGEIKAETIFIP